MAEMHHGSKSASDNLGLRALLYASEGMDASDAALFEQQLGNDQRACEALAQAVEFLQRWDENMPSLPDTRYRLRVRERLLRSGARVVKRLTAHRRPLTWSGVSAVAAALLAAIVLSQLPAARVPAPPPVRHVAEPRQMPLAEEPIAVERDPMTGEELELWADLPRSRHLLKVHHEESERKRRSELQMRVVLRTGMGGQVIAKNAPAN